MGGGHTPRACSLPMCVRACVRACVCTYCFGSKCTVAASTSLLCCVCRLHRHLPPCRAPLPAPSDRVLSLARSLPLALSPPPPRSSGWVPKSGLKFGVEFLAYRQGPVYFHSSYIVIVKTLSMATLQPMAITAGFEERPTSWPVLSNLNRMSQQVGKELLVCNLLVPPELGPHAPGWDSPHVLGRCKVQHVLLRRWIPEKTRFAEKDAAAGGGV